MRRPPRNLTIVVTVLAVAAVVGFWAARGGGGGDQGSPGPGSPVVARIAVDDSPRQALLAADGLWVVGERALYRIDPSSNRVVATIPVGTVVAAPAAVALAADAAWVPAGASTTLWRVDRAANRVAGRVGLDRRLLGPVGVAARDGTVWVSCCAFQHGPRPAGMLLRVDTRRNRVVGRVMLAAGSRVEAITATPGAIWAVDTGDHNLLRLDPRSGRVGLAVAAPVPRGVGVGDGGAWAIVTNDRTLARVDEQAGRLRARVPAEVVRDVRGIAIGPGALWVTTGNEVVRLDPRRLP